MLNSGVVQRGVARKGKQEGSNRPCFPAFLSCDGELPLRADDESGQELLKKSVSISSFLNGPFDTPKQNP